MNNKTIFHKREQAALRQSNALFRIGVFLIIGVIVIMWMIGNRPHYMLVISEMNSDEELWMGEIEKGQRFSHRYIHSVEKSPVKEVFQFSDAGEIVTMESWTKSFGAGLPYQKQGEVDVKDGYYIMKNLNRPVHGGILRMKPSDLYPHTFSFQEETFYLSEEPFVNKIIEIDVKTLSWWELIKRRGMKDE